MSSSSLHVVLSAKQRSTLSRLSIIFILLICAPFHLDFAAAFAMKYPSQPPSSISNNAASAPAYLVIEAQIKSTEMKQFSLYAAKVPPIVAKYGGEYIVLGGEHVPLEGDWGETRIVLHRWPCKSMAKDFWESEEYKEVKKLRQGTGNFRIMLVEGLKKEDVDL